MFNPETVIAIVFTLFVLFIAYCIYRLAAVGNYFPEPKDLSVTVDRYYVIYRSPRFGTCTPGGCCDICDGKRVSQYTYVLGEAREIQKQICKSDLMAATYLEKAV